MKTLNNTLIVLIVMIIGTSLILLALSIGQLVHLIYLINALELEREVPVAGRTLEIQGNVAINPVESEYEMISMNVSAFCGGACCCGKWADGQTASGHWIKPGDKFVAAPPEYPFGTIMDVPGYGKVLVFDRGGAIKGNKLDLYFDEHQSALIFGRRQLEVKVWR